MAMAEAMAMVAAERDGGCGREGDLDLDIGRGRGRGCVRGRRGSHAATEPVALAVGDTVASFAQGGTVMMKLGVYVAVEENRRAVESVKRGELWKGGERMNRGE